MGVYLPLNTQIGSTMTNHTPWTEPGWQQTIEDWIRKTIETQGYRITGPLEQFHAYPWSTVLRIPTQSGSLFFKATALYTAQEAALTEALSKLQPESVPRLLAVDAEQGWMIMQDGGQRLREQLQQNLDLSHWEALLPVYAALQQKAAPHIDELIALGVPRRTLAELPALYKEIVAQEDLFLIGPPDGVSEAEYQRLRDLTEVVTQKCAALASYGIPDSIQHGDLHDGNVFYNAPHYAFYDWGDCAISHPFFSLRVPYVSVENRFQLPEGAPEFERLGHSYLSAWRDYATEERLNGALQLAAELWPLGSLLNWYTLISHAEGQERAEYAYTLPSLAQEFLGTIKV